MSYPSSCFSYFSPTPILSTFSSFTYFPCPLLFFLFRLPSHPLLAYLSLTPPLLFILSPLFFSSSCCSSITTSSSPTEPPHLLFGSRAHMYFSLSPSFSLFLLTTCHMIPSGAAAASCCLSGGSLNFRVFFCIIFHFTCVQNQMNLIPDSHIFLSFFVFLLYWVSKKRPKTQVCLTASSSLKLFTSLQTNF